MTTFLKPGDRGGDVITWQRFLSSHGLELVPDGIFGPSTEAATRALQAMIGAPQSGRLDQSTLDALNRQKLGIPENIRELPTQRVFGGFGLIAAALVAAIFIFGRK